VALLSDPVRRTRRTGSLERPAIRWLMVLPTFAVLAGMSLYPLGYAVYMSVHNWQLTFPTRPWIGIRNYKDLLTDDPRFINSLERTALIGGAALAIEFLVGFALALFFWSSFRSTRWLATLVLVPMMVSPVVVGFTARMGFTDSYGFVNQIISLVVGHHVFIEWLGSPTMAPYVIILADVWQWTPFVFLIMFAGLMSVSQEQVEAARVDGARHWQVFRYIILPSMRNIIIIALILRGLELIKLFDVIQLTTRAGPGIVTETVSSYIYTVAFNDFNLGYASAAAFILLVGVSVLVFGAIRLLAQRTT
jgi:multiple sugar transport system permease protein